jgi:hypothetical protein
VKQVERPKKNRKKIQRGKQKSRLHHYASSFFCVALKMVFDWSSSQFGTKLLKLRKAGWSNKLASLLFAAQKWNFFIELITQTNSDLK